MPVQAPVAALPAVQPPLQQSAEASTVPQALPPHIQAQIVSLPPTATTQQVCYDLENRRALIRENSSISFMTIGEVYAKSGGNESGSRLIGEPIIARHLQQHPGLSQSHVSQRVDNIRASNAIIDSLKRG